MIPTVPVVRDLSPFVLMVAFPFIFFHGSPLVRSPLVFWYSPHSIYLFRCKLIYFYYPHSAYQSMVLLMSGLVELNLSGVYMVGCLIVFEILPAFSAIGQWSRVVPCYAFLRLRVHPPSFCAGLLMHCWGCLHCYEVYYRQIRYLLAIKIFSPSLKLIVFSLMLTILASYTMFPAVLIYLEKRFMVRMSFYGWWPSVNNLLYSLWTNWEEKVNWCIVYRVWL